MYKSTSKMCDNLLKMCYVCMCVCVCNKRHTCMPKLNLVNGQCSITKEIRCINKMKPQNYNKTFAVIVVAVVAIVVCQFVLIR